MQIFFHQLTIRTQDDKVNKKMLVLAGSLKNTPRLRAVSRPPLWIRISPTPPFSFHQAWAAFCPSEKHPYRVMLPPLCFTAGMWLGRQWAGPAFLFSRCQTGQFFLWQTQNLVFFTVFWLRGICLDCRELPDLSAIRTEDRENLERRFRV